MRDAQILILAALAATASAVSVDDLCPEGYQNTQSQNYDGNDITQCVKIDDNTVYSLEDGFASVRQTCAPAKDNFACCKTDSNNKFYCRDSSNDPNCNKEEGLTFCSDHVFNKKSQNVYCGDIEQKLQHEAATGVSLSYTTRCLEPLSDLYQVFPENHDWINAELCAPSTPRLPCCQKETIGTKEYAICDISNSESTCDVGVQCTGHDYWSGALENKCPAGYRNFRSKAASGTIYNSCVKEISFYVPNGELEFFSPPATASTLNKCTPATNTLTQCCPAETTNGWQICSDSADCSQAFGGQPTDCTNYDLFSYTIEARSAISKDWRISKIETFTDSDCTFQTTGEIRISTLNSQPSKGPENIMDGTCDTYWEENFGFPLDLSSGAAASGLRISKVQVDAEEEIKCVKVYQPRDPSGEHSTNEIDFDGGTYFSTYNCEDPDDNSGLSDAALGGIIGGSIGGVALIGGALYWRSRKRENTYGVVSQP